MGKEKIMFTYSYKEEYKELSLAEYEKSCKTATKIQLVYYGPYLNGIIFRTREDPGRYFITPISEKELKQIIPEGEDKLYESDPEEERAYKDQIKDSMVEEAEDKKERMAKEISRRIRFLKRKEEN